MSNINIRRVVENIRAQTSVYTPVVEAIVNAIQAIEASGRPDGRVEVRLLRDSQHELDESLPPVKSVAVTDNGIGFNDAHRQSFDTLYTDLKVTEGGKGFGRFVVLKYFADLRVDSVYEVEGKRRRRRFKLGHDTEIIVDETDETSDSADTGSTVTLAYLRREYALDKKLYTIARNLAERLLPYFISDGYDCPAIVIKEDAGGESVTLNDFFANELSADILEVQIADPEFHLRSSEGQEAFAVRIFKLFAPRQQRSRISLVAHKREVAGSALQKYVPEFEEEFYEANNGQGRNYVIKAYVFGDYLDRTVSLERGGFEFQNEGDAVYGIGQVEIEAQAASIARSAVAGQVLERVDRKRALIQTYVDDEAPWHKELLPKVDISSLPMRPAKEEIEARLQKEKFAQESQIRADVKRLLASTDLSAVKESVTAVVDRIADSSKNDLIHYVALRRTLLDLFGKSLESGPDGRYSTEGMVHDIIFPRKADSDRIAFEEHNLWLLDERLNFTRYVASDLPLNGPGTERPDLVVFGGRVAFRGANEASNPVTIFEFKKPQRHDFANPSSDEDPVQQVVRYVIDMRDGKYRTPEGREMLIADSTPFYGYVVCDLNVKVKNWLEREKDFTPMPDNLGWFRWMKNINLYVEVVSWDKVLRDARMRNEIFFSKLGI